MRAASMSSIAAVSGDWIIMSAFLYHVCTTSFISATMSHLALFSFVCLLLRRSVSISSSIRASISLISRIIWALLLSSSSISAARRVRVRGERSSWLMARSNWRLASSICCMSSAIVLKLSASSPSSSFRLIFILCSMSPAPNFCTPALIESSGENSRRVAW